MTTGSFGSRRLFEAVVKDLQENVAVGVQPPFSPGTVDGFTRLAKTVREETGLNRVCLSGGTFHNLYLSEHLEAQLLASRFDVFTHHGARGRWRT